MTGKPVKIVVVSSFNRNKRNYPSQNTDGFFVASWGALYARRLKALHPDLDIEVWRPEAGFTGTEQRVAFRVPCTIFPYRFPVISDIITLRMLRMLRIYQDRYRLVIHLHTISNVKFNILAPLLLGKAQLILSYHGGNFPAGKKFSSWLKRNILLWSYKKIDTLTYLRKNLFELVSGMHNPPRLAFLPVGANFKVFHPLGKAECRKKLGLSGDKIYAVYVGRYYKLKGVDHILSAFEKLKSRNFEILFVGGLEVDEFYPEVVKSGNRYWGYISQQDLAEIYSAADFYIHPALDPLFGGLDTTWMEALACGTPVVTPQFRELTFDYSELGVLIRNSSEILEKVTFMVENHASFRKCREVAGRHLDGNTVISDRLLHLYTTVKDGNPVQQS